MLNNDKSESIALVVLCIMFVVNCFSMRDMTINGAIVGAVCGMLVKKTDVKKVG